MLSTPMAGLFLVMFSAGFGLFGTGLNGLLDPPDDPDSDGGGDGDTGGSGEYSQPTAADFETVVEDVFVVNDLIVLEGEIDTEEVDTKLTDSGGETSGPTTKTFEKTDSVGGYTVYEPTGSESDERTGSSMGSSNPTGVAVDETAIVLFETNQRDTLEALIDVKSGTRERAAATNDDVAWLLDTAGKGHIAFGGHGRGLESDEQSSTGAGTGMDGESEPSGPLEMESIIGVTSSLTFDGTTSTSGATAIQFTTNVDEIDDANVEKLETQLGSSADNRSVQTDGDRISATAEWDENALDTAGSGSASDG
jgi:hypothetical protein